MDHRAIYFIALMASTAIALSIFFLCFWKKKLCRIKAGCGHITHASGEIHVHRVVIPITLPVIKGSTPYCLNCIKKQVILCPCCGRPIVPGDAVTVCEIDKDAVSLLPPHIGKHIAMHGRAYICCSHPDCAGDDTPIMGILSYQRNVTVASNPRRINDFERGSGIIFSPDGT